MLTFPPHCIYVICPGYMCGFRCRFSLQGHTIRYKDKRRRSQCLQTEPFFAIVSLSYLEQGLGLL